MRIVTLALIVVSLAASISPVSATEQLVSHGLDPSAYTASDVYSDYFPRLAFDDDSNTWWNATTASGWLEVDLGAEYELSRIELQVQMIPDGGATHQVWISNAPIGGDTSVATMAHEFTGSFSRLQILTHFLAGDTRARYIQVRTTQSVSWVAWREMRVFAVSCQDVDGDGFYYESNCGTAQDCNDASPTTYPGAAEVCDGYDSDCDWMIDNGCDTSCVSPDKMGSDVRVTNAARESYYPSLVWTGSEYGVSWDDLRDGM